MYGVCVCVCECMVCEFECDEHSCALAFSLCMCVRGVYRCLVCVRMCDVCACASMCGDVCTCICFKQIMIWCVWMYRVCPDNLHARANARVRQHATRVYVNLIPEP
jgi:hypothetical protein